MELDAPKLKRVKDADAGSLSQPQISQIERNAASTAPKTLVATEQPLDVPRLDWPAPLSARVRVETLAALY